jgi:hypothetical protein
MAWHGKKNTPEHNLAISNGLKKRKIVRTFTKTQIKLIEKDSVQAKIYPEIADTYCYSIQEKHSPKFFYEYVTKTKIPKGFCVCHKCATNQCFNIDHIRIGTFKSNMQDKILMGNFDNGHGKDVVEFNYNHLEAKPVSSRKSKRLSNKQVEDPIEVNETYLETSLSHSSNYKNISYEEFLTYVVKVPDEKKSD